MIEISYEKVRRVLRKGLMRVSIWLMEISGLIFWLEF